MSYVINTRSPFYTSRGSATAGEILLRIRIWTGHEVDDRPTDPTYELSKEIEAGGVATFEISELIRDYLLAEYLTESTDAAWVQWVTYEPGQAIPVGSPNYIAVEGYGYFEEGINPRSTDNPTEPNGDYTPQVLQDARKVYFIPGEDIRIPIWGDAGSTAHFVAGSGADVYWNVVTQAWETYQGNWGTLLNDIIVTPGDNTEDKIYYIVISGTELLGNKDVVEITSSDGLQIDEIELIKLCEPKFTPIRISFYNKYGAQEDIWASKKSSKSLKASSSSYKRSILQTDPFTYSTTKHTDRRFDVTARESITVNTDLYTEDINEAISQLLLSEQVWLTENGQVLPVILKTESVEKKTSVKDKMVQYSLDFEYAFDKIQSVR